MKSTQLRIAEVVEDDRKKELEAVGDQHAVALEHLFAACKAIVRERTADEVARELDVIWGERGRGVTAQVLRAALADSRGNYFRLEWILYFAEESQEVRELLIAIGRGDGPKDPREELEDLKELLRNEYPKQAEQLIRKGKARRR